MSDELMNVKVVLPLEVYFSLCREAVRSGVSRSIVVEKAIRAYVKED